MSFHPRLVFASLTLPFAVASTSVGLDLSKTSPSAPPQNVEVRAEAPKPSTLPVLVDLTLKGEISEDPAPIGFDGAPINDNLKGLIERLAAAREDKSVKGLVLRLRGVGIGWAKCHELRQAIKRFRTSGKRVYAFLETADNADYLVAAAADEIVMPEGGWLVLKGITAEVTFYKGLFDKLGVEADWMQVGEFKSYGEPFTRTSMSPAFREEMSSVLNDFYGLVAQSIADRQGISTSEARALVDGGPYTPSRAKALGLVNRVAYPDVLEAEIAKDLGVASIKFDTKYGKNAEKPDFSGFAGFMRMMQALSGENVRKASSKAPKVALIHASGSINTGKSSAGSILGESVMGSETVIKNLREAEQDATVKAIVLRVDSPGGSALASDLIWREVTRIKAKKPIVASMSDVAASGGYYISVGCDRILAEPGTLTGSIGVTGGKFVVKGLMDKLGVTTETVSVGKNGGLMSMNSKFSDTERAALRGLMDETYRQFVSKTAQGRKMKYEQVEKLAGGRVYSGRQAKALGLVDELGTLDDALALARDLGGIPSDGSKELLVLPKPQGVMESLMGSLGDAELESSTALDVSRLIVPAEFRRATVKLRQFSRLFSNEPVLLMMPFEVRIR